MGIVASCLGRLCRGRGSICVVVGWDENCRTGVSVAAWICDRWATENMLRHLAGNVLTGTEIPDLEFDFWLLFLSQCCPPLLFGSVSLGGGRMVCLSILKTMLG